MLLANDGVRFGRRVGDVTRHLFTLDLFGKEGERRRLRIAVLRLETRPIDGAAVQTRRSAGLQALPVQTERPQLIAQQIRGSLAASAAAIFLLADMRQAVEERAGGDDHRVASTVRPSRSRTPVTAASLEIASWATSAWRIRRFGSFSRSIAHAQPVLLLVALRPRRPHRRAAAGVQQSKLNPDRVRHFAHHAAQRVDFAHQMPFGDAADGWIARHLRDQVQVHGDHRGLQAQPGARARRLAAGMSGSHNHHLIARLHEYLML